MKNWLTSFKVILAVAFLLRVGVIAGVISFPEKAILTDSKSYLSIAHNLSVHQTFSSDNTSSLTPDMMRTPVYPGLLYVLSFMGISGMAWSILLLQLSLSVLICFFVLRLVLKITNNKLQASIAGWFMALDVPSILFTGFILTETLFTFLLVMFLWFMVTYLQHKQIKALLLSSVFLGLAMLCRPIALFLPFWIMGIWILFFRKTIVLKHSLYFLIPVMVLCGSWIFRNYLVFNQPFFTKIGTFNLAWFQASMVKAEAENISLEDARWNLFTEASEGMKIIPAKDPVTFFNRLRKKSVSVLIQHPGIAVKNMLKAEINLLFRPCTGYTAHWLGIANLRMNKGIDNVRKSTLITLLTGWQLVHLFFLYAGIILLLVFRKTSANKPVLLFIFLVFFYFLIPGTGPEMEARFRIPLLPMLAVLSVCGWRLLINRNKHGNQGPVGQTSV